MDRSETVLEIKGRRGNVYTLVALSSGAYAIARNGEVIAGECASGQMKDCMDQLVRLAAKDE